MTSFTADRTHPIFSYFASFRIAAISMSSFYFGIDSQVPYVTVFDISQQSIDWWFPAIALALIAVGILFIKFVSKWPGQEQAKPIGWIVVIGTSFLTLLGLFGVFSDYSEFLNAYKSGQYDVVEGIVQDFDPMPYSGHQNECFRVEDERFCYSDYVTEPGFRQTASHGGPIREGLPVRIAHYNGRILRLEIRADSVPSASERSAYAKSEEAKWIQWTRTDPLLARMNLGFAIAALIITLWWNLDWKHFVQFWQFWFRREPPYASSWKTGFRVFFLVSLVGAAVNLSRLVLDHPRTLEEFALGALFSLLWIGFFIIMDISFRRRLRTVKNT